MTILICPKEPDFMANNSKYGTNSNEGDLLEILYEHHKQNFKKGLNLQKPILTDFSILV